MNVERYCKNSSIFKYMEKLKFEKENNQEKNIQKLRDIAEAYGNVLSAIRFDKEDLSPDDLKMLKEYNSEWEENYDASISPGEEAPFFYKTKDGVGIGATNGCSVQGCLEYFSYPTKEVDGVNVPMTVKDHEDSTYVGHKVFYFPASTDSYDYSIEEKLEEFSQMFKEEMEKSSAEKIENDLKKKLSESGMIIFTENNTTG